MIAYDIRIRWNAFKGEQGTKPARVRLSGFGFRKYQNLRILQVGLASIKARIRQAIGADDAPTQPLKSRSYARFKARIGKKPVRDLTLTGELLAGIQPRYADNNQAIADATGRKGRLKARIYRDLLIFSPNDQAAMSEVARDLFNEQVAQVQSVFSPRPNRAPRRSRFAAGPVFRPN